MKLRTKFAVVLLVITVVLSGGVYGGLELFKDHLVGQVRSDVNETARLTADQLDATVEQRKDFVGFVASRPDAARWNRSDRFLAEFVDNSRFFAAQLVAADGTIVDFHGDITQEVRRESIGSDVGDRPYVAGPLSGDVHVSDPEYSAATGKHLVIFSAPIFEDRELVGVLAASIYLDTQTFFGTLSPLSTGDQAVSVRAGNETLYERGGSFDRAIEVEASVESAGWTVTVSRDRTGLVRQLRDLAIAQGLGVFVVMLSVVAFGVWEYRTTLDQTAALLEGFAALEAGDFDHTLSLAAAEEWEQIGRGFNELAAGLASRETELRRRGQRLEVLNRVLRHNLRNTAGVILGYADMIETRATDDATVDAAARIEDAVADLARLSGKARQIEATMDADGEGRAPIDVSRLVADVATALREEYPDATIETVTPDGVWATAVPSLGIAVENLVENACEHAGGNEPAVEVRAEVDGDRVRIAVADDGPGIPEQERTVLSEGRETPLEHGSGLGLWLVQWTVERSGGELRFAENDPEGSVVTIELERARDREEPLEGAPADD